MKSLQYLAYQCRNYLTGIYYSDKPVAKQVKTLGQKNFSPENPLKILFVANGIIPTLGVSFLYPLSNLIESGWIQDSYLTEVDLKECSKLSVNKQAKMCERLEEVWSESQPDLVISCRYSGPISSEIISKCNQNHIPFILYLDDDLLNVPKELGPEKYAYHNHPKRTGAIRLAMEQADVIYSSTPELTRKINSYDINSTVITADIFCASQEFESTVEADPHVFGYMGFGHSYDLDVALDGIVSLLQRRNDLTFELFGTIPKPKVLDQFGERVLVRPPVRSSYTDFMKTMNELNWAVGITPLADLDFNRVKANTKWVEYSSVGTAVVSSDHIVYRDSILPENGLLVQTGEDWGQAIEQLLDDRQLREFYVSNAQQKLKESFTRQQLQDQVLQLFQQVGLNLNVSSRSKQAA